MATHCGPESSTLRTVHKTKKDRSRPNLSRLCAKTKMCSFYLRGACTRGESCSFAHDEKDIQSQPDLSCTKPCPDLLRMGFCSRSDCKYAHEDSQIRLLDLEKTDTTMTERESVTQVAADSCTTSSQMRTLPSAAEDCLSAFPVCQELKKGCQSAFHMNDFALSSTVSLGEMIFHMTHIFSALYEASPEIAKNLNAPAAVIASATAKSAWARAGVDSTALLSFRDVVRWCALPSDVLFHEVSRALETVRPPSAAASDVALQSSLKNNKHSPQRGAQSEDSDTGSQCSTNDGNDDSSNRSVSRSNSNGWETPEHSAELEEEGWREPELGVRNTFIHFSPRRCPNKARRTKSLPGRLS